MYVLIFVLHLGQETLTSSMTLFVTMNVAMVENKVKSSTPLIFFLDYNWEMRSLSCHHLKYSDTPQ